MRSLSRKEIEYLPQTQIFESIYRWCNPLIFQTQANELHSLKYLTLGRKNKGIRKSNL